MTSVRAVTSLELIKEARTEVNAAQQNLREAIAAWETLIAKLHPAALFQATSGGAVTDGGRASARTSERAVALRH